MNVLQCNYRQFCSTRKHRLVLCFSCVFFVLVVCAYFRESNEVYVHGLRTGIERIFDISPVALFTCFRIEMHTRRVALFLCSMTLMRVYFQRLMAVTL